MIAFEQIIEKTWNKYNLEFGVDEITFEFKIKWANVNKIRKHNMCDYFCYFLVDFTDNTLLS